MEMYAVSTVSIGRAKQGALANAEQYFEFQLQHHSAKHMQEILKLRYKNLTTGIQQFPME